MHPRGSHKGRQVLVAVTLAALALQAIKLGARVVLLHKWPTAGQWGQLALVVWLLVSLWEGKNWARVATAAYYTLATLAGVIGICLMWHGVGPALRWVLLLTVVLTAAVSYALWFSLPVRLYLAERLAEQQPSAE